MRQKTLIATLKTENKDLTEQIQAKKKKKRSQKREHEREEKENLSSTKKTRSLAVSDPVALQSSSPVVREPTSGVHSPLKAELEDLEDGFA